MLKMSVEFFLFYLVVRKVPTPFLGQKYDFEGLDFAFIARLGKLPNQLII